MTDAQAVWDYQFSSPSDNVPNTSAGDWLKYARSAYVEAQAAHKAVEDLAAKLAPGDGQPDLAGVLAVIRDLAAKVQALIDTPMVDAVAVAEAIKARPEIAQAIAAAVAANLGTITVSGALSGDLTGRIGQASQ